LIGFPFRYRFQIRLHDTDAAGVLFFAHLLRHAHDAYESMMHTSGLPLDAWLREPGRPALPITEASARFERPMRHGDQIEVELRVDELRRRSFALGYVFRDAAGRTCALARTVHVMIGDEGNTEATHLPDDLARVLRPGLESTPSDPIGPDSPSDKPSPDESGAQG
jgi:1,4-dihydroxy-2-naphthoyl-CoA hydrolase